MSKTYSGKRVIDRLVRIFGFRVVSQNGSHVKLKKQTLKGTTVTIVPLHSELAEGTLRGRCVSLGLNMMNSSIDQNRKKA